MYRDKKGKEVNNFWSIDKRISSVMYDILEPAMIHLENEKLVEFRLDGHGRDYDDINYPKGYLKIGLKHRGKQYYYKIIAEDITKDLDEKGEYKLKVHIFDSNKMLEEKPEHVHVHKDVFYIFVVPRKKSSKDLKRRIKFGSSDYFIDYDLCKTPSELLDWVHQISGKTWCTADIIHDFVRAADKLHKEKTGLNLIAWGGNDPTGREILKYIN